MKDQLISFETAKLAKEKGFGKTLDTIYPHAYKDEKTLVLNSCNNCEDGFISAPTQSELQKWLREVHNIHLLVEPYYNRENTLVYGVDVILEKTKEQTLIEDGFESYELSLEFGLYESLKLL